MKRLPPGLYELLHTRELERLLEETGQAGEARWDAITLEEVDRYLALPLAREISLLLRQADSKELAALLSGERDSSGLLDEVLSRLFPVDLQVLGQIREHQLAQASLPRPDTRLSESALLTGSARTPSLQSQMVKELASCDRADWLVSFIKFAGIRQLYPALQEFTSKSSPDGRPRLRIATTSYMGATDIKAVRLLQELPNTEIRVSLDTKRTRLHAKAYLFHRESGFGSAYIGSANISKAAMNEGLEWTAKVSQFESLHLWQHAAATFDSHWEDETEFTPCTKENIGEFIAAISSERGNTLGAGAILPFFDLRPHTFQQAILEDIAAERAAGRTKHLIIAATGTGKTMVAAFDYKAFCEQWGGHPRLLFVAHREEILKQAQLAFSQVLKHHDFGDLLAGGKEPSSYDHLFCTVQSWNSRGLDTLAPDYYDYIVLDEAHHAAAASYQRLIDHIEPFSLVGLTATPERADGGDIRDDFGGSFTHELRLTEAVERNLLCPFHYYGIPDAPGIDFSSLDWKRGGYQQQDLDELLGSNDGRAQWVRTQTDAYVADIRQVRGLGFCVSVTHARFMAAKFTELGVPSMALTAETPKDVRDKVQWSLKKREINFIFTVDLYNEGVDLPFVDTVLFLRPTESLTIFLQQLGRGLRLDDDKSQLTVLDFIAPQNRRFDFISRFRALSMRPEKRVDTQIEAGMPFMPTGCFIQLERQSEQIILDSIRDTASTMRGKRFLQEVERLLTATEGEVSLQQLLDYFHLDDPDPIYRKGLPSQIISAVTERRDLDTLRKGEYSLGRGFRKLLLMDDPMLLAQFSNLLQGKPGTTGTDELLHCLLWGSKKPGDGTLDAVHQYVMDHPGIVGDLLELIDWMRIHRNPIRERKFPGTGELNLHGSYSRAQILLAAGKGSFEHPAPAREGVLHIPERKVDLFFADIDKDEADFSPTTMYEDYAVTDKLFHWQSQSGTGSETATGRRYINHERMGYTPYLFIRRKKQLENGLTAPYLFAGPLRYRRHQGSKPMSILWELGEPLPAKALTWARRVG